MLNVGGNSKAIAIPAHYDAWAHLLLDIDPAAEPDVLCDARKLTTLAPRTFDAVYCSHNLEHYYKHDVRSVLRGFLHVLKDDGFAEIRVPDLRSVMERCIVEGLDVEDVLYDSASGPITVCDVLYGFGKQIESSGVDFFAHKTGFTARSLKAALEHAGFEHVFIAERKSIYEVAALAFKQPPAPWHVELLADIWQFDLLSDPTQVESLPDIDATVDSEEVTRLCDEASEHLEAARFPQALELLTKARQIAPRSALVQYRLALYHADRGELREALDAIDASLRAAPQNAKAHNNRGSILLRVNRSAGAEAAFRHAIELDPTLAPPYLNLGSILEYRGAKDEAIGVYEQAIARGLDRDTFEQCRAVAASSRTRASPESWVRTTFDNFAPGFDAHLRELRYRMPEEIARLLGARATEVLDILDLGCGTGLCGVALRNQKRRLVGVDLSPKMLHYAADRGVYDETHVGEVHAFMRATPDASFDAIVAADVFIYIGALDELFEHAARILRPGGWFAFSTEEWPTATTRFATPAATHNPGPMWKGWPPPTFASATPRRR